MQFVKQFDWILLNEPVEWEEIDKAVRLLMAKKIFPEEMHQQLCNNFGVMKANINEAQKQEFNENKIKVADPWVYLFEKCAKEDYNYAPLALIVSYILAIPGNFV